ncbi:H/ACA RNA-protein complex component Gar1 [Metallosphaera cuprina Ar-4]|uniref:H/ACA RNA-protein complex component Gar1 n=1 Tax=Metallosphaera cuprina (strain Ar-4) TaxID=1006006 RepID=F4G0I4_METCR|nr:H/ACA RNA-protein complex component Gar1 [Metallosphaera cuprina Ar-4]
MTGNKIVSVGEIRSIVLGNKWLVEGDQNYDYSKRDPTGLIIVDSKRRRVGKVLDVIGNVTKPFLLVEPLGDQKPYDKLFLEVPVKKIRRNRR